MFCQNVDCVAGNAESRGESRAGFLAGIVVMVTVVMVATFLVSIYMYRHPTSSVSIFLMEVSGFLILHLLKALSMKTYIYILTLLVAACV